MNRRPNPEGKKIKVVLTGGRAHYYRKSNQTLSDSPNSIKQRRCRDRIRKLIDCRICSRCRYAFISRSGQNNCSACYEEAHQAYRVYRLIPKGRLVQVGAYRAWAQDTGFFPWGEESMSPKYPVPNMDSIKDNIARTFAQMQGQITRGERVEPLMPRVLGLRPYLNVQPIPDLRKFRAKAA